MRIWIVVVAWGVLRVVAAEPPLTLADAVAQARAGKDALRAAREAAEAARGRTVQAGAIANPTLGGEIEETTRLEVGQTLELCVTPGRRRPAAGAAGHRCRRASRGVTRR